MLRLAVLALVFLATLGASLPAAVLVRARLDPQTLPGLRVDGIPLAPTADPRPELRERAELLLDAPVALEVAGETVRTTRRALGGRVDVDLLAERLLAYGRTGDVVRDLRAVVLAREGRIDLGLEVEMDPAEAGAMVELVRPFVDREPREGRFDIDGRLAEPHVDGARLDGPRSTGALLAALARGDRAELVVETLPVRAEARLPAGLRLDTVVARYRTRYHTTGRYRGRAHNVELAAERIHGAVIEPGQTLSFNGRVGERTRRAGFRRAPVISGGELVDGVGGGVCQVASTLHAAVMHAGMESVEHRPHSRPSTYVPMGLDATVVWPSQDLQVRNPFDFPIAVHASARAGELVVELLGAERPFEIEISRRVLARTGHGERVIEDPGLPRGARVVSQAGIRGARVEVVRVARRDGAAREEREIVRYPATDRIVRVGVGASERETVSPTPIGALAMR